MEVKRYEVRVIGAKDKESVQAVGKKEETKRQTKTNEEVSKTDFSKGLKTTIGAMASIYATSQLIVNPIMRQKSDMAALSGDIVQAKNIQRTQARVNQTVNLGFTALGIAAAFIVNPMLGAVTLGGSVTKEISSGINRVQSNRMLDNEVAIDSYINAHEQVRMTKLIR